MSEEKQNGSAQPQELKVPEGDHFLFVGLGKNGEFQLLYSDPLTGLALLTMADEFMRTEMRKNFGGQPQIAPTAAIPPGLDISSMIRAQRKMRG